MMSRINVYEMYHKNGCKFGFFVARSSWGNTLARIVGIEGVSEGNKIKGRSPYFNNPKVTAEFYKQEEKQLCNSENIESIGELSCPGTFQYTML